MTANTPDSGDTRDRAAKIIADALTQGLLQADAMLAAERDRHSQTLSSELVETLERFGEALGRIAEFTERLAQRMNELTDAVTRLNDPREAAATAPTPQLPDLEPTFPPGGEGVDVTIAAVPGFQGLMDVQRALVRLPHVQGAAVRRYQDDEAAIQLVLSQPMTASTVVEGVTAATGLRLVIDESRPDALRLRLRFLAD